VSKKQYRKRNSRMYVTDEEKGIFMGIQKACDNNNVNVSDVKHGWLKDKKSSIFFKNPLFKEGSSKTYDQLRDELWKEATKYAPQYPTIKRKIYSDSHLLVVDPADIHIGKLATAIETGDAYDSNIAVQRVKEGVLGILQKVQTFNIDKIVFIGGNDILHIDTPKRTTTSGTPQDTDGMWYDNYLTAKKLYIEVLEMLIGVADVHFVFCPSNHDYMSGFFLADSINAWFRNCDNITFDVSIAHRKYLTYGNNLISATHGDGAKMQDLPLLMANESKDWSSCKHKYIYTHHIHHKVSKDFGYVTVESLRSPSGTDSWHKKAGYISLKAIEGFLHHKDHGQIARITHLF